MWLVASVRTPVDGEGAAAALGKALGLSLAEARIRLAPEPPAILASLAPEPAAALVAALRQAGLAVLALEVAAPSGGLRVMARTAVLGPLGGTFQARTGAPVELPWGDVITLLRGASTVRSETESTQKSAKFSAATAIATSGLKLSRSVERTTRSQQEETEQAILLHGRGGQRVVLRERELDFSCLGAAMQPTRTANMVALARLLKERAPAAFYDERLLRLGRRPLPMFVGGETREQSGGTSQTRLDTSGGMEVLAELLSRAVEEGLLP
ncbi:hypothetical protein [Hyalangium sp.]|uniref:hypothetical protein n=1 Tax=Hyalangium sp. TaxID=2028555 RepID=UPI002D2E8EEE|nr:hypothetical protein [Hyalangium sp.]HYH95047.1 hypothetical protein [Hyalangium sp.]